MSRTPAAQEWFGSALARLKYSYNQPMTTTKAPPAPAPSEGQKTDDDMVRVNAQVTVAEHRKIKIYAAQQQTTISVLLREYIKNLPD